MTGDAQAPAVELSALDHLWFQVAGTLCNLACSHCLVTASPTNRTHEMLSLEQVRGYLDEAARLATRAAALAEQSGDTEAAERYRGRAALYESGKPFVQR